MTRKAARAARPLRWAAGLALLAGAVALAWAAGEAWHDLRGRPAADANTAPRAPIALGVLGDSDSQSYQSERGSAGRFGAFHAVTLQWTEALARLRGDALDLGPWGLRGTRRSVALAMEVLGLRGRHPPKEDYLHDLAAGGAGCAALTGYEGRQAQRLLAEMDRAPQRWRQGVVVVRIGINDLGGEAVMDAIARDADDVGARQRAEACVDRIDAAMRLVHARHPLVRFVLVGVLNNADDPSQSTRWPGAEAYRRIGLGLDRFDDGLRRLAAADPQRIAFFDDRAWFAARWGSRDDPRVLRLGPGGCAAVRLGLGDDPRHAVTADAHAGIVWTTLWAQSLVTLLRERWQLPVPAIGDAEVWRLVEPAFALAHALDAAAPDCGACAR